MGTLSGLLFSVLIANPVSPGVFGQVFQNNKASVLLVKTGQEGKKFTTGFVVGARGEFVFGLPKGISSKSPVFVKTATGAWLRTRVISKNPELQVGLGRIQGNRVGQFTPLRIGQSHALKSEDWLVVLAHDDEGSSEPFAGTLRARVKSSERPMRLDLDIPGDRGSPVFSTRGDWVGVVHRPGRRKSKAWTVETIVQFLKGVSLDQ